MYKSVQGYGWTFGECSDIRMALGIALYMKRCCFSTNENILTCRSRDDPDWSKNAVAINGNEFCDAENEYLSMIKIDVLGT